MGIVIEQFRPVAKNTLVGFIDIRMTNIRLIVRDLALHRFGERWWVSMPGKPMVERDGTPIINARTGRQDYFAFLRFDTRTAHADFERQVLAAMRERHPEVFAEEMAP
jgi:hypothetical protein